MGFAASVLTQERVEAFDSVAGETAGIPLLLFWQNVWLPMQYVTRNQRVWPQCPD